MTATIEPRVTATSSLLPVAPAYGVRGKIARQVVKRILRGVPVSARLVTGELYGAPLADHRPLLQIDQPDAFFGSCVSSQMRVLTQPIASVSPDKYSVLSLS